MRTTIDMLLTNANVLTLDEKGTQAGSVAITDGKIVGIWETKRPPEDTANITPSTKIIDLEGATLIPGFIDTHNHLQMYAQTLDQINCSSPLNQSIKDIQQNLQKKAATTPLGEWIIGYGYDDTLLSDQRHPTREDLDAVVPNHPVFIKHISGHLAVANSLALQKAGLKDNQQDPAIGHYGRDANGKINGVLYEFDPLEALQTALPEKSKEDQLKFLGQAVNNYLAEGITTNTDAAVGMQGMGDLSLYVEAVEQNVNPLRMQLMIMHDLFRPGSKYENTTAIEIDKELRQNSKGKLRLDSAKMFQDGSIQGLTGALREPYHTNPEIEVPLNFPQEEFNEEMRNLHERGFRVAVHGNGDRAIGSILDAFEYAIKGSEPRDHRHRIEHVQTATKEDLDRMKELQVAGSFFINHVYYWGDRHRDLFLGPERASRLNPVADAIDRDLLFTLHSDCPITPISPLFSIWAAVNRVTKDGKILGPDQRCDVETALKSMTIYGAKLNFDEEHTGSIEVGKVADFAVLDANPLAVDPMTIKDINVLTTIINGEIVYTKEPVKIH